jgi:hypothetical protein
MDKEMSSEFHISICTTVRVTKLIDNEIENLNQ